MPDARLGDVDVAGLRDSDSGSGIHPYDRSDYSRRHPATAWDYDPNGNRGGDLGCRLCDLGPLVQRCRRNSSPDGLDDSTNEDV